MTMENSLVKKRNNTIYENDDKAMKHLFLMLYFLIEI